MSIYWGYINEWNGHIASTGYSNKPIALLSISIRRCNGSLHCCQAVNPGTGISIRRIDRDSKMFRSLVRIKTSFDMKLVNQSRNLTIATLCRLNTH